MATITEDLRIAIIEFKELINSYNFVINHEQPPLPIGSIESYKAQLSLANEYLKKHPEFNSEDFNHLGLPLYVKDVATSNIERMSMKKECAKGVDRVSELLWDAYMVLDKGDHDERLVMLDKLKSHFEKVGKPLLKSNEG